MATTNPWASFEIDVISVTLKYGFLQKRMDYPLTDPSGTLLQRLYRDAELWIREIAPTTRTPQVLGSYRMNLFRIPSTEFTLVPITRTIDIEQNSLIEIVLIPMENSRHPHALIRYQMNIPTNCSRCSRLITGIYKQGYRCQQCRLTFHKECASSLADDCCVPNNAGGSKRTSQTTLSIVNPMPIQAQSLVPAEEKKLPRPAAGKSPTTVIEKGIFPACRRGDHIYRRYAFFLTKDALSMSNDLSLMNAPQPLQSNSTHTTMPLLEITDLLLTHFMDDRDDIFEIHLLNRTVLSVGKKSDSNALQMETAQFYSYLRDQWETLINTTPAPSPSASSKGSMTFPTPPPPPPDVELRVPLGNRSSIYRLTPQDEGNRNGDLHELYTIHSHEKIGEGQFGRVVTGMRKSTHQEVAIKIIEKTNCDERELRRINEEIDHLYKFNHMNILKLEAYFERDNAVYLVTERMETDMCKYITGSANGYLDEHTTRMLIYQVMIALRYLHKNNYAHLDVKCENILLTLLKPNPSTNGVESTQDYPLVKLADFGYSRIIGEHSFRKTRVGTKVYNAPEIYRSGEGYNRLVDMWSIGIVLYAALSGTLPYPETDVQYAAERVEDKQQLFSDSVWRNISAEAKDLISEKLLVVQPASRVRSNDALFHDWFTDYPLFQNLREIEKRAKHYLSTRRQMLPPSRWLTDEREDLVWSEYKTLYAETNEK